MYLRFKMNFLKGSVSEDQLKVSKLIQLRYRVTSPCHAACLVLILLAYGLTRCLMRSLASTECLVVSSSL
jgi:hypothetical protein